MPLYRPHPLTSLAGYSEAYYAQQRNESTPHELRNDAIWRPDLAPQPLANLEQQIAMAAIPRIFGDAPTRQLLASAVPSHVHDRLQTEYVMYRTTEGYVPSAHLINLLIVYRPTRLSNSSWVLSSLVAAASVPSGVRLGANDLRFAYHDVLGYTYVVPRYYGVPAVAALGMLRWWVVYLAVAVEVRMLRLLREYDAPRVRAINEAEGRGMFGTDIPIRRMYASRVAEALGAAWFDLDISEETLDAIRNELRSRDGSL